MSPVISNINLGNVGSGGGGGAPIQIIIILIAVFIGIGLLIVLYICLRKLTEKGILCPCCIKPKPGHPRHLHCESNNNNNNNNNNNCCSNANINNINSSNACCQGGNLLDDADKPMLPVDSEPNMVENHDQARGNAPPDAVINVS